MLSYWRCYSRLVSFRTAGQLCENDACARLELRRSDKCAGYRPNNSDIVIEMIFRGAYIESAIFGKCGAGYKSQNKG